MVIPSTLMLVFFSKELMWIWTQNEIIVNNTWIIVAIFSLGTGINGLIQIHYQLAIAYGWWKLPFQISSVFLVLMVPLTLILSKEFGTIGGASSWLILNILSFIFNPLLLHRKYLRGEFKSWFLVDILKPLIVSILLILCFKFILTPWIYPLNRWMSLLYLIIIGFLILLSNVLLFKNLRIIFKPLKFFLLNLK